MLTLVLAILTAVLAVVSGFGVRMEWWGFPVGFKLLKAAFILGLINGGVAIIVSAAGLVKKIPLQSRALPALIVSSLVAGVPYFAEREFRKIPTYVDATSNFEDPPVFVLLAEERKATAEYLLKFSAGEAETAQRKYFPDLESVSVEHSVAEAKQMTREILLEMGLSLAPSEGNSERVEATDSSFWFGFKDDVVAVFKALPDGSTQVDVRSASRVGKLDGGANARRVQAILAALRQAQ